MQGKAHEQIETHDGTIQHRSKSTSQVLEYWNMAPAKLEMRVRRLKRIQTILGHQWRNGQILTSLF
eukprot:9494995-Pyramimonas_sp.AAC.1